MATIWVDVIECFLDNLELGGKETGRELLTQGALRAKFSIRCDANRLKVHSGGPHDESWRPITTWNNRPKF